MTVIVMLILAQVAISVLTSQDGLFNKTSTAAAEYKKAKLNGSSKTAELYLEVDRRLAGNESQKI